MAEITLHESPKLYPSERGFGEVLLGEDDAAHLMDACQRGDEATLRDLMADASFQQLAMQCPHRIYSAPSDGRALARPILNVEHMLDLACRADHANVVRVLLAWASENHLSLVNRFIVQRVIERRHFDVFVALCAADPKVALGMLHHDKYTIEVAARQGSLQFIEFLASQGVLNHLPTNRIRQPLLSYPVRGDTVKLVTILLDHGASTSGGLHAAAKRGDIVLMDFLAQHNADVNEPWPCLTGGLFQKGATPLTIARAAEQAEACAWLEARGAVIQT